MKICELTLLPMSPDVERLSPPCTFSLPSTGGLPSTMSLGLLPSTMFLTDPLHITSPVSSKIHISTPLLLPSWTATASTFSALTQFSHCPAASDNRRQNATAALDNEEPPKSFLTNRTRLKAFHRFRQTGTSEKRNLVFD